MSCCDIFKVNFYHTVTTQPEQALSTVYLDLGC